MQRKSENRGRHANRGQKRREDANGREKRDLQKVGVV
jgi:hypothetical protein